jgi:hypothetical protein
MIVGKDNKGALVLAEVDPHLERLLVELPAVSVRTTHAKAERRLFPVPSHDEKLAAEWEDFVRPELETWFHDACDIVQSDLQRRRQPWEGEEGVTIRIPQKHIDAWLNCLARARLILNEEEGFTEAELESIPQSFESKRDVALFRLAFYGLISEILVREAAC